MNLELMAMRWLRFEKRLPIIIRERSPRMGCCGQPDVWGVSASRYVTEIEIKRSVSDFRADQQKRSRRLRDQYVHLFPKQFYYLVLHEMADKVAGLLPEWAGLMRASRNDYSLEVVKTSPINTASRRLSVKECARLVHQMANHILSAEESLHNFKCNFRNGFDPLPWPKVIDFVI